MKMNMISTKAKKFRAPQSAMPAVRSQATHSSGVFYFSLGGMVMPLAIRA